MLIVPDAEAAIYWYRTALGATELWNLGGRRHGPNIYTVVKF